MKLDTKIDSKFEISNIGFNSIFSMLPNILTAKHSEIYKKIIAFKNPFELLKNY